ncbi:hypothetical protein C8Q79DRAFT_181767 [Trametes meyenii]|nr:hypothetical protein C8Q79DRAFT_181767 [Trametes meyenii]
MPSANFFLSLYRQFDQGSDFKFRYLGRRRARGPGSYGPNILSVALIRPPGHCTTSTIRAARALS